MAPRANFLGLDHYALVAFKGCHNRVRDGKVCSIFWPRSRHGYLDFCEEMGPKPAHMVKPSVGRIDHSRGYEPGNVRWEEHAVNSIKRKGTKWEGTKDEVVPFVDKSVKFKRGSPEHKQHARENSIKRWSDPQQKIDMSLRMKGNQHAKKSR